ncbi:MAG TPA: ABC transporter permease, partial [Anaerolineales bacterium]|nr:ABC transporter permease [Anaerolineales bacterium]
VSLTVYHIPTAVVDQSQSKESRDFIQALVNSQYFDVTQVLQNQNQIMQQIDAGQVKAGIVILPAFASDIESGNANVLILLDGADSFSVQSGYSAASIIAQNYSIQLTVEKVQQAGAAAGPLRQALSMPITTSIQVLYNPDLRDLWFILPAIVGMIMQSLAVVLAAMAIVREREVGTLEQLLATPTRPLELILGKMIPLLLVCLLVIGITLGLGVFWFGVPFQGNLWLYLWLALLFIASSLGLGLLVSTVARNQKQAQQITQMLMIFSMLLTGLVYPRNAMPVVSQFIGDLIPLTYFIRISRGIVTKGVGLSFFWGDALVLLIYGITVMIAASLSFRNRLD